MTDQPLTLVDSHGDDSDESHNPFDDRVEQAQKELMWAQLQRRYMNVWEYTSRRWNAADILTVLRNLERGFHIYSGGNNEQLQDISGAHLYLRNIFIQFDGHNWRSLLSEWTLCDEEGEYSENELKSIKERLQNDYKAISDYLEFFAEVSMVIYGREAQVISKFDLGTWGILSLRRCVLGLPRARSMLVCLWKVVRRPLRGYATLRSGGRLD